MDCAGFSSLSRVLAIPEDVTARAVDRILINFNFIEYFSDFTGCIDNAFHNGGIGESLIGY